MIETPAVINESALDALKSVLGADFPELVRDFRAQSENSLIKLELAVARDDRDAIKSQAHILKGSALSLHASPLAKRAGELESMALSAETLALDRKVKLLHQEVKAVWSALEQWAYH